MLGGSELVTVGLNHRTAPVEVRERLAIPSERVGEHLSALLQDQLSQEGLILSTCNRVEVYGVVEPQDLGVGISRYLARAHGLPPRQLEPHLYRYHGTEAVSHLFRVACSLDSLVVGEPQILGQVKDAFRVAAEHRAVGRYLGPLLRRTLSVAKRIRTETRIGQEAVSVGSAGVELARQVFGRLERRRALLLGAGEMGRLVATSMLGHGVEELVVANRTYERAVELSRVFGATAVHLDQVESYLGRVDIVIAATGSQRFLISRESMAPVMRARRYKPLFMVDLSVPRNIDPRVHELEGAYLFNVDDLTEVAQRGLKRRQEEANRAEGIVLQEALRAYKSLGARSADPVIASIVAKAEGARRQELERSAALLGALDPAQREVVDAMTKAMFKRFLHDALLSARRLGAEGDDEGLRILGEAFGVSEEREDG
ncbi:MAG: glutamyl-tRNA reductase [Alphaproteobacteria bacterium]|nr:glutamyl-tRNA reductase [Alphaproteobacteria bacterium]MCB9793511.1 glutamyl-tRNA reductase [Alphaproteobacteria bacterium]